MFGTPENNNTELRSDTTSGDVSEVESGLEVTESEMDDELSKELDGSFDSFISDKKITTFDKEQKSEVSSQQREPVECSFVNDVRLEKRERVARLGRRFC